MSVQKNSTKIIPIAHPFLINPSYSLSVTYDAVTHSFFLNTIQQIVDSMIPEPLWSDMKSSLDSEELGTIFYRLQRMLPIFRHSQLDESSNSICISYMCPADYTHGVGRYVMDTLSRWLVPGRQLAIVGGIFLNFQFVHCPSLRFFLDHKVVSINNKDELEIIRHNLPELIGEMKINIMSVYHARYISTLRNISTDQKNLLIQENLSGLLNQSTEDVDQSLYDQMQGFISKLDAEEKIDEVKKNISKLVHTRPKAFDRNIFYEMTHFTVLFSDEFSAKRKPRHISRVIAYQYLFKKLLQENILKTPAERHLSIKILKTTHNLEQPLLAILIGMNFLKETERFEIRHLLDAIRSCEPTAVYVDQSLVTDRRHEKIRFFYLEIQKPEGQGFTHNEIKLLRQKLPTELIRQIENVVHPIFMPRNEEELIRNLIVLSKQIKYVRDLPQITIHYEKQAEFDLTFTVIILRLLKGNTEPINKLLEGLQSSLKIDIDDIRIMGYLKQKYPKEATILRLTLDKSSFFRPDYSVDLLRARQKIVSELEALIGEFRDFNGGMILKQDEALTQLRQELGTLCQPQELLLETYFYSLKPGIMQTIHDSAVLRKHFELLIKTLECDFCQNPYQMNTLYLNQFFLGFIKASAPNYKEEILNAIAQLKIPSHELTTSYLQIDQSANFGFILRTDAPEMAQQFESKVLQTLRKLESGRQ
ncbi:MAG: hypothetical protein V4487_03835 [Chlamydiota bacterium]